jgi:molybdopterin molybdotransferase
MLSLEAARELMLAGLEPLPTEEAPLDEALGRVLGESISSRLTLPPWDNSAMDGFAVRAADIAAASAEAPIVLDVVGEAAAGRLATGSVGPGTTLRILTGAPVPKGSDAVVPVEQTDAMMGVAELPSRIAIFEPVAAGAHIRPAGGDLRAGEPLLDPGSAMTPATLALAAAGGHGTLRVHRLPSVAVLTTGDELVPPGQDLGPAQIPDSNSIGLVALAVAAGAQAKSVGIARDSINDVTTKLRQAMAWADVVVASGGVSVGAHDVVKDAFAQVGRVDLWRVAVQPGKPLAFGRGARPAGGDVLLFGLPGNPVSSQVTFELFVRPVLRRLAGHADLIGREIVRARLAHPVRKAPARRAFLRVRLLPDDGGWRAELAGGQESHMLSALARADGLAVVTEDVDSLPAGAIVEVLKLQ